jgi:glutathione S-transferase
MTQPTAPSRGKLQRPEELPLNVPENQHFIYHITTVGEWERALRDGEYTMSTRDRTLAEEGFIHASTAEQVAPVANMFYKGLPGLVVLTIDASKVKPAIRYERVPGSGQLFPHVYGPLNTNAVVEAVRLEPDPDGDYSFTSR